MANKLPLVDDHFGSVHSFLTNASEVYPLEIISAGLLSVVICAH